MTPGGDLEGAIAGVSFPAYVIDSDGVIRWINDAARELVGDGEGQELTRLVARQSARFGKIAPFVDGWNSMARRERDQLIAPAEEQRIGSNEEGASP